MNNLIGNFFHTQFHHFSFFVHVDECCG